ncbi:acetyl/propionyl-CoA carboxylase subunit alpha [Nocardioides marmoriginsengisoli]|uniref:Acetyl/propionyl-CoA carboxylase subunit alpha n=1 Tax=Nocardioides marmoriginsengisoli TaxID=661483 RepID=A0A3N0CF91_9ACTN|nr:biotin carboxylase N-terminal domain-containing protein [Nocardioides marmoriginsengisoli]RNL62115.1 acetyl/propionyl-CoA carboxylase subunit alpha [Nocardioides marmoriginsengisoli]
MTVIAKILVANRGEIARRVFTTARRLGIGTVAVYSDADAGLPFVAEADLAVRLPGNTPAETYLRGDLVIEAAKKAGADAIHPGYGFLSENADFARAVIAAGLTWIGPTPESIDSMGSKIAAKELMAAAGVPVFGQIDPADATEADLPLLVKASAGGGGRGMRIVRSLGDLAGQVELASTEAASAFGDATVFCEPYLENGRHVEVQVVGDTFGNVLVLGERDCSLQRRHQKVVEEAPAPGLSDQTRRTLHEGAALAAKAIGYVGAGTVEFMVSTSSTSGGQERVSFLEMNTRLQVEHPVTEAVFGIDLVEAQVRVAEGGTVPEAPTHPRGHAVEVRLYAEDPAADYQPQSGLLDAFDIPTDLAFDQFTTYGTRLDSGFVSGSEVGTHYDAMLAKVICWAPTRELALRQLAGVLHRSRLHGIRTNRDLLVELLGHPDVVAGRMTTNFLAEAELDALGGRHVPGRPADQGCALFAAAVALVGESVRSRRVQQAIPAGWRNVYSGPQVETFDLDGTEIRVGWRDARGVLEFVDLYGEVTGATATMPEEIAGGWRVVVEHDGLLRAHDVFLNADRVDVQAPSGHVALRRVPRFVDPAEQVSAGSLLAPMPGTVIAVQAESGAEVEAGQTLLVLEAMKMQHSITAPGDGVVEIAVKVGQQVSAGDVLAVVTSEEESTNEESA